jgi:hypothetical protein
MVCARQSIEAVCNVTAANASLADSKGTRVSSPPCVRVRVRVCGCVCVCVCVR